MLPSDGGGGFWLWEAVLVGVEEPKELGLGAAVRPSAGGSITWSITKPRPPEGSEPETSRKQNKTKIQ